MSTVEKIMKRQLKTVGWRQLRRTWRTGMEAAMAN